MTTPSIQSPPPPPRRRRNIAVLAAGLIAAAVIIPAAAMNGNTPNDATYSEVTAVIESGTVESATIDDMTRKVTITKKDGTELVAYYPIETGDELATALDKAGANVTSTPATKPSLLTSLLITLLPVVAIIAFLLILSKRGGLGGLGGLKLGRSASPVDVPATRFTDIAGIDEAVAELQEVVDFLHDPERFERTGASMPRGFLLIGGPGTGKTLLARAVAGEAGVPFINITGSEFVQTFVGVGPARVRELFAKARESDKAILFIDEIDAVGKARSSGIATGANDERESTLNQLLVEMDGFARTPGLIMIAATNRPDILDPALLRPGRFDRHVVVPPPDRGGRTRILELYARDKPFDEGIDWDGTARRIPGMTGAEIEQMLNEAALDAARKTQDTISQQNVEAALATSIMGRERKSAVVTDRDRGIVAYHEAGHCVCAMTVDEAEPPVHVTIIPRGTAGGVTWMNGPENDFMTRRQALARLVVAMGGRAGEEVHLDGDFTQGAHGDLQGATRLATEMIARYGMGRRLVAVDLDRATPGAQSALEEEASVLIEQALGTARAVIAEQADLLHAIANALLDKESLNAADLDEIRESTKPDRSGRPDRHSR